MPPRSHAFADIVERTPLDGFAVVTARLPDRWAVRPYATFVVSATSRYAQRLSDHVSIEAALYAHRQLVERLEGRTAA